jgi:hypothetical protein
LMEHRAGNKYSSENNPWLPGFWHADVVWAK